MPFRMACSPSRYSLHGGTKPPSWPNHRCPPSPVFPWRCSREGLCLVAETSPLSDRCSLDQVFPTNPWVCHRHLDLPILSSIVLEHDTARSSTLRRYSQTSGKFWPGRASFCWTGLLTYTDQFCTSQEIWRASFQTWVTDFIDSNDNLPVIFTQLISIQTSWTDCDSVSEENIQSIVSLYINASIRRLWVFDKELPHFILQTWHFKGQATGTGRIIFS